MSQDNPTPQPPNPRGRQQRYQRRLPFWKVKIIQFLRGTIGVLETTANQLEDPSSRVGEGIIAALTGIIAFVAVIVVWTTSSFNSKPASQVATVPPETPPVTVTPEPTPTPLVEATPLPPVASSAKEPQVEETPIAVETPQPEIEQTPVAEVTPEPTPTPTPTPEFIPLTPEQTLIAAIENKVSQVSNNTFSGIVKSIKANFRSSSLIVTISDDWYTLKKSQQDKLATEMFQRSQELDFTHLEIFDSQDKLVARNPVIGNEMIIFQRQLT
ncbi:hypothetical protein DSM106972_044640 [Dulcicalothrix desertica PCC 7102]|uniref:Uncharacterized protein n=1 Tax=Dulcicalothrix desertica PCC 7102 TaxID=232991 RepID=A0A3S1ALW1_9CYAN|nr:hypothetical protein [Dulcicalothrix desertica]RUT04236.1 hypothetical protein DSM106972_044640 [Dulcicalothrix desertica PCC 7102]TWH51460.1 hypothetical protein CAL7102_05879 [Dulcicalothrix desertica PCC 7102]